MIEESKDRVAITVSTEALLSWMKPIDCALKLNNLPLIFFTGRGKQCKSSGCLAVWLLLQSFR